MLRHPPPVVAEVATWSHRPPCCVRGGGVEMEEMVEMGMGMTKKEGVMRKKVV